MTASQLTTEPATDAVLAAVHRAAQALAEGRVNDLVAAASQAADIVPPDDIHLRWRVASVLQAAFRFTGKPALFDRALAACRAVADHTEQPDLAIPARALAGNVLLLAGQYHRALEHCDASIDLANATGRADDRVVAMGHQFRGYVLFEWNRLTGAAASLERAWAVTAPTDRGVRSGVARVMAEVCLAGGNRAAAGRWIERLTATVSEPLTLRNREWLAAVRARHGFAAKPDLRALDDWRRRHDYRIEALADLDEAAVAARLHELEHLLGMLEVSAQWKALGALAAVIERGSGPLRAWYRVRALTAGAVALEEQGRQSAALEMWARALGAGREGGFVRVYLDGSPGRDRLLRRALDNPATRADAARVLADSVTGEPGRETAALTARQVEVLRLVADGLPDRDIGNAAGMSMATVKTHLRAIYARLGVHSRTAAVAKARKAGML